MGFIDWHGNKQDQYEEILAFAKMKEKMETDNFGSQREKKKTAEFFGVPELLPMEEEEIAKLLLKEKKSMDILYDILVQHAPMLQRLQIDSDMAKQFYADFWRYSVDILFRQTAMAEEQIHQFVDGIVGKLLKVENSISTEEHYQRMKTSESYRRYFSNGFELKSGNTTLFWQWIRYLSDLSAKQKEGIQFFQLYQRFMNHLSYYIHQLIADVGVGRAYREREKTNAEILRRSLATGIDTVHIKEDLQNPIFEIHAEEERKRKEAEQMAARIAEETMRAASEEEKRKLAEAEARRRAEWEETERRRAAEEAAEERRKKFLRLTKCARIVLGYYILDTEDESDMITAGRLYCEMKEKRIEWERMVSIVPKETSEFVKRGILPVISDSDVKFRRKEQEVLHYVEYVSIYMQGAEEETIDKRMGTVFLTNQRIQLEFGSQVITIPFEHLKKAVIYDVMPEIMEVASSDANYFIRTADTQLMYQMVKMILGSWANAEVQEVSEPVNMEQLTIGFLEKESIEAYLFGIRAMMDGAMPEKLISDLEELLRSLEFLDTALKKYPSFKEQSDSFFSYYIPETVKILFSYQEYEKAGLSEQETNPVYEKVLTAIQKLSVAAKQQVTEIYKRAIVDTTARAEALTEILGQDGYVDSVYKITI